MLPIPPQRAVLADSYLLPLRENICFLINLRTVPRSGNSRFQHTVNPIQKQADLLTSTCVHDNSNGSVCVQHSHHLEVVQVMRLTGR